MSRFVPRGLVRRLLYQPFDGLALTRAGWRLRRRRWFLRPPFLPVPDVRYWNFRMTTVNGSESSDVAVDDAVRAAKWSVRQRTGR